MALSTPEERILPHVMNALILRRVCMALWMSVACLAGAEPLPPNIYAAADQTMREFKAAQTVPDVVALSGRFQAMASTQMANANDGAKGSEDAKSDAAAEAISAAVHTLAEAAVEESLPEPVKIALNHLSLGLPGMVLSNVLATESTATPRRELQALSALVNSAAQRRIEELLERDGLLEQYHRHKARAPDVKTLVASLKAPPRQRAAPRLAPADKARTCEVLLDPTRSRALLAHSEADWLKLNADCTR